MSLSAYAVYVGVNIAEGTLAVLDPQPAIPDGLRSPELNYYGDGSAQFNGQKSFELVWNDGITTVERNGILTAFGLGETVASETVTLNHRLNSDSWQRSNCQAVYTQTDSRRPYGKQNLRILILNPQAAS